jgi:hypothetical protein
VCGEREREMRGREGEMRGRERGREGGREKLHLSKLSTSRIPGHVG